MPVQIPMQPLGPIQVPIQVQIQAPTQVPIQGPMQVRITKILKAKIQLQVHVLT